MFTFWLGSAASFNAYQDRQLRLDMAMAEGRAASPMPEGFQLHGNVAVVDVQGDLVNYDSWLNDLFGMTAYSRICQNLIEAATHPDVKEIVLAIDSPGGTPNGLPDAANLIRRIQEHVPVTAFSDGYMTSAAYLLGASCSQVFAGETATLGSIGVIATMLDRTEQMKKDGLRPVVVRSGSKKALLNPYEPITKEVEKEIQAKTDYLYDWFTSAVQEYRDMTASAVEKAADGQEFLGTQAVDVGLVDGITTLDALVGGLQTKINKATTKESDMAKKRLLTETEISLIAEGVPVEEMPPADPQMSTPPVDPPVEPQASDPPTEPQASAPPVEPPATQAPNLELTAYLREELAAKSAEVLRLNMSVADLTRQLDGYKAHHEGMRKVVEASINRMEVGLKRSQSDLSHMPDESLLAHHAAVNATFCSTYLKGGKSVVEVEDGAPSVDTPDPLQAARLRASKITSN